MNATMATAAPARRPIKVPKRFLVQDKRETARMIGRHVATYVAPLAAASALLGFAGPSVPAAAAATGLAFLASFGLHSLGLMGHEGTHFNLHPKRFTSAAIGVVASSLVPFHLDMGFAISHNQHHRFTNTDKDPDVPLFGRFGTFLPRLFLARLTATREYAARTLVMARDRHPVAWDEQLNLPRRDIVRLARLNVLASVIFLALHGALAAAWPVSFGVAFAVTVAFTVLLSGLRPYLEHAGTDEAWLTNSQSWISPAFDALYGGINYHLAHHVCPGVPAYRIKEFHAWLMENGHIARESTKVVDSLAGAWEAVSSKPYGAIG